MNEKERERKDERELVHTTRAREERRKRRASERTRVVRARVGMRLAFVVCVRRATESTQREGEREKERRED